MAVDIEDLMIQPFKDLVERGNEAVKCAEEAQDEDPEAAKQMLKSALAIRKEGERALLKLQPLWASESKKHGNTFRDAINGDDGILEGRRVLEDLLYDFDDFMELGSFELARFIEVQAASKALARKLIEAIKRLRIEEPASEPTKASPNTARTSFPPLPPLPPLPSLPPPRPLRLRSSLRSYDGNLIGNSSTNGIPVRSQSLMPVSNNIKNGTARPRAPFVPGQDHHSSTTGSQQLSSSPTEGVEMADQRPSALKSYGNDNETAPPSCPARSPLRPQSHQLDPIPPMPPLWTVPRTNAWVDEQASSGRPRAQSETIPEDAVTMHITDEVPGSIRTNRSTMESNSKRGSSLFDPPVSPVTSHSTFTFPTANGYAAYNKTQPVPSSDMRSSSFLPPLQEPNVHRTDLVFPPPKLDKYDTGNAMTDGVRGSWEDTPPATPVPPIWYSRESNCAIGPESSFYQQGGFCRGAYAFVEGGLGAATKATMDYVVDLNGGRPYDPAGELNLGGLFPSPANIGIRASVAKCIGCEYRHTSADMERDVTRDSIANFRKEGVVYRLRFLYKSHLPSLISPVMQYACLFCVEEGCTTREGDATVFSSQEQLFRHLSVHPQPLPAVPGITVKYGPFKHDDVDREDYDVRFPQPPARSPMAEVDAAMLTKMPVAVANKSHTTKYGERDLMDPDGRKSGVLKFFAGARIVGVDFPEKWDGKWCRGWHDGVRGAFPVKFIAVDPPGKSEVRLPGMNNDGVTLKARWKWDTRGLAVGWLGFDKGDIISNVSWTNQDQWCWSGMTKNGKVGFFPQSHIKPESVRDATGSSSGSSVRTNGKPLRLFGLRR